MQVQAIKLDEGWFVKYLPGFEGVKITAVPSACLASERWLRKTS